MKNQPIVRLNFTCNRNWEDMQPVENGRFCNDCQKTVVDFTGKTNDEIAAYLMSSTTKACGRFQDFQLALPLPKPLWKRWLSAVAVFVAVFMGIKEASGQNQYSNTDSVNKKRTYIGDTVMFSAVEYKVGISNNEATFPGGEAAFKDYLLKNLQLIKGTTGRVIAAFTIEKDGSLTDIKVLRGLNKEADEEAVRVLKSSPKWEPGHQKGIVLRQGYVLPIDFGK